MAEGEAPIFPSPRECPLRAPALYRGARAEQPVIRARRAGGEPVWVVTGYELSRRILADPRASSDRTHEAWLAQASPAARAEADRTRSEGLWNMFGLDSPDHGRHRRMLAGEFTPARIEKLRPRIQEIVDQCVGDLLAAAQPADLVEHVAFPVSTMVICELLGVPYERRHDFQYWTKALLSRDTPDSERQAYDEAITGFLDELITAKENGTPGDDVLGRLISRNRETGALTHAELVSEATLILAAGHETTANMISLGTAVLLENRAQRERVSAEPALWPGAVEELLRYLSVAESVIGRAATADIELGEATIRAGERIVVAPIAANWDETVFEQPDELDLARQAPPRHIAFGYGAHLCLGQHLARTELEIVFETLFRRAPDLALAVPADQLRYQTESSVYGLHSMPVTF
jgi:cytochrome P450